MMNVLLFLLFCFHCRDSANSKWQTFEKMLLSVPILGNFKLY